MLTMCTCVCVQALRKIGQDFLILMLCVTVFLSYLPEAGEYSSFFVYLRLVIDIYSAHTLTGILSWDSIIALQFTALLSLLCLSPAFIPYIFVYFHYFLVRPKTIVFGRTSVLRMMFFLYFFSEHQISEMRGPTGVKFCTMVSTRPNFIMPVQNFGRRTPKKFRGQKTCKIWPDFGRLRSSAANISEKDEDIQNRIFTWSTAIPPALGETSPVKFGPVTLEISMLNRTHPKCIFRKTIFRPLGGAAPPNF